MMITDRRLISLFTFISLGMLGFTFSFIGTGLPEIQNYFKISVRDAGLITTVVQLGYAVSAFLGGVVADNIPRERLLMAGCFLLFTGTLLLRLVDNFAINLFFFAITGIGLGAVFISSNALVVELFTDRRGTFLNIHHIFFAVASFLRKPVYRMVFS